MKSSLRSHRRLELPVRHDHHKIRNNWNVQLCDRNSGDKPVVSNKESFAYSVVSAAIVFFASVQPDFLDGLYKGKM